MLIVGSALKGYHIEATDGHFGTVKTFLFDDRSWKLRWLVVDTGKWLPGRLVLIHPSSIGQADHQQKMLPIELTKVRIEASPDIAADQPVTMQLQDQLYSYYGSDPYWGPDLYQAGLTAGCDAPPGMMPQAIGSDTLERHTQTGDPHLGSISSIRGYHSHATDGSIGHVEDVLLDDENWVIHYLIIDTRNWWPGARVLVSPFAVEAIDWADHDVRLTVRRDEIKASPAWDPADAIDQAYERRLHTHYGWPGYGS